MGLTFIRPVDIANRALDHVGGTAIDETLAFSEPSRNAVICNRVYDKLRQAELRRNEWDFAVKHAVLRPLDTNTMLLTPTLWVVTAIYFVGSIVADINGQLWYSTIPDNIGNQPGLPPGWAEYAGPMSVSLYSTTTTYFTGELVYTTAGDGTVRVYQSRQNVNADNPSTATAWDATAVYFKDDVV